MGVYEISMSTVIKMECDDCSTGKFVEKETISHIREKVEFRHTEEAALSALFNEFGSARFVNYESSKSPSRLPFMALIIATTGLAAMLRCKDFVIGVGGVRERLTWTCGSS